MGVKTRYSNSLSVHDKMERRRLVANFEMHHKFDLYEIQLYGDEPSLFRVVLFKFCHILKGCLKTNLKEKSC